MSYKHLDIPSDPKDWGKGAWVVIHVLAYNAKTRDDQLSFCKQIRIVGTSLPCHTCRKHATEFIKQNPPENDVIDGDEKAMFKYSCKLHNNANKIQGKSMVDWTIMYKKYADNSPKCVGECAGPQEEIKEDLVNKSGFTGFRPQLNKGSVRVRQPLLLIPESNIKQQVDPILSFSVTTEKDRVVVNNSIQPNIRFRKVFINK